MKMKRSETKNHSTVINVGNALFTTDDWEW